MSTESPPIVSLQPPKNVSITDIETELGQIWQNQAINGEIPNATRASTFTFIVYEPEPTQYLLAELGFYDGPIDGIEGPATISAVKKAQKAYGLTVTGIADRTTIEQIKIAYSQRDANQTPLKEITNNDRGYVVADAIAATNPCRVISLCPILGEGGDVTAQVSAYCPVQKRANHTLVCCEYITLRGTVDGLERNGGVITAMTIGELPKFLWWKDRPDWEIPLFRRLATKVNSIILDSADFSQPIADLKATTQILQQGIPIADLNWYRIAPWQELAAEAFDPPERRKDVWEIDRVEINYEKGNPNQALMFLGWLASRLQWQPTALIYEDGDYDLRIVHLVGGNGKEIIAELAAMPVGEVGTVVGDIMGIRLASTNPDADCSTILCSEVAGCMQMESRGKAQSSRIEQVTQIADQNAELLLSQHIQRWGRDVLYEETIAIVGQILS